jgi:hypothetical protein
VFFAEENDKVMSYQLKPQCRINNNPLAQPGEKKSLQNIRRGKTILILKTKEEKCP